MYLPPVDFPDYSNIIPSISVFTFIVLSCLLLWLSILFEYDIDVMVLVQNPNGGAVFENSAMVSAVEESEGNSFISAAKESDKEGSPDESSYDSKLESGTITFDFGPSNTSMVCEREASPQNDGREPPLESRNTSKLEDGLDSLPFSGQIQRGLGESSFSGIGPSSALISYSGQIAHSGNISLRSDSSTTSTRSFAFPVYVKKNPTNQTNYLFSFFPCLHISKNSKFTVAYCFYMYRLQSEWNSSPVRMAKADRRHLRKHRGWRQGLLCCRF